MPTVKNAFKPLLCLLAVGGLFASASANATYIADTYIGGTPSNPNWIGKDVIGALNTFDVTGMEVVRTGSMLSVDVLTNFAGKATSTLGYGDLFLHTAWTPFGSGSYINDNALVGTQWSYGFALNSNGTGSLYKLNGGLADILLSDDKMSSQGVSYRNKQAVLVNRNSATAQIVGGGTWSVDTINKMISFDFDLTGTTLASSNNIALHWNMWCGNDTIEGLYKVPEPASLAMLGLGLLALSGLRRKA